MIIAHKQSIQWEALTQIGQGHGAGGAHVEPQRLDGRPKRRRVPLPASRPRRQLPRPAAQVQPHRLHLGRRRGQARLRQDLQTTRSLP